ncbi:MAG: replicative DNA helicase [Candidatus Puniceispirillum sp.]|uniref:replicative DNA helicase n=2 Tax=Candidatus Puniceispirillum TaxID=767891 RepID=UPI001ECF9F92|nr:replicative DNA helicase [Candidatus Puniceispirillum sp.]MBT6415006.1 replicative DNA helicase [Candidatus Puniceispirillum sp.]
MAEEQTNIKPFPTGVSGTGPTRKMPHNLPAEQNLLGALLLDNSVMERIDDRLRDEHFYDPLHGRIFKTITRMTERGQLANPVTLKSFFTGSDDFPDMDAQEYLTDLADGVISISQAPDYAHTIHEAHLRRELILISDQVITDAIQPEVDTPASTQIETAEAHLFRLAENDTASTGLRGFDTIIAASVNQADLARKNDGHLSGASTGLTDLNNLLGGLQRSDLIILAGRPAMGKTALATNIAFHAATTTKSGEVSSPVAFFSLEMAAEQLGTRILSERARVDSESIRRGKLDSQEFDQLVSASTEISSAPFFIDDTPSLSVSQLASRARRLKRTTGLGVIVVDYLQLLTAQLGVRSENRVQEISNISRTLKAIAKELDVPVLALSQLSRAVEMREDKRPNLSDLRESGSIEQDADVVMFVYREEYYLNKREPEQKMEESVDTFNIRHADWLSKMQSAENKAEIIVAKQRHGPTGSVNVHFEKRFTHFTDLTESTHLPEGF